MTWESVIGIEVHVELATRSKMFCGCAVGFGDEPNTNVCPTCLGLPGALPVPNLAALDSIMAIGIALNCTVAPTSVFHRKNYFYADLPKNYQISQFDVPICVEGHLDVTVGDTTRTVGIERAHMEEDTGKSTHVSVGGRIHSASSTMLDFNRSGVPLVEIVSKPEIHSAAEARAYAQTLRSVVAELGVSDARLEEGSIRFDANVSVRPEGEEALGTKVEVKNMNSFRSLERAVQYEIDRQIELIESSGTVIQETRHWDEESGLTRSMRTKEGSSDYRYFAEPDLVPMRMDKEWVDRIRATLPELPAERVERYVASGLETALASVLSGADAPMRGLYESAVAEGADARSAANWVIGEVTAWLRRQDGGDAEDRLTGRQLAELLELIEQGTVSISAAKDVLDGVLSGEGDPGEVARSRDLLQISDTGAIEAAVDAVLAENPDALESLRSGEAKVLGFLVGQVMRATQGKADPKLVNEVIRARAGD
jgi:aspartyl-tRNA(Asn)/glutamyl-tRNA(Gln) amidotransferase subunit B